MFSVCAHIILARTLKIETFIFGSLNNPRGNQGVYIGKNIGCPIKVRQELGKKKGITEFHFHNSLIINVARTGDDPVTS